MLDRLGFLLDLELGLRLGFEPDLALGLWPLGFELDLGVGLLLEELGVPDPKGLEAGDFSIFLGFPFPPLAGYSFVCALCPYYCCLKVYIVVGNNVKDSECCVLTFVE